MTRILCAVFLTTAFVHNAHGEGRVRCTDHQVSWEFHSYYVQGRRCWAKGYPGKYRRSELYWEAEPGKAATPVYVPWEAEHRWQDYSGWSHQE